MQATTLQFGHEERATSWPHIKHWSVHSQCNWTSLWIGEEGDRRGRGQRANRCSWANAVANKGGPGHTPIAANQRARHAQRANLWLVLSWALAIAYQAKNNHLRSVSTSTIIARSKLSEPAGRVLCTKRHTIRIGKIMFQT